MCLADVVLVDTNEVLMTNTSEVQVDKDTLSFRDLFGQTLTIQGSIVAADFEKNRMIVKKN
ncbi:MAG: CooT family nickel-binding protein [Eubacterium sp.]|nr:CooT family nickel-binding protein [Eubacterium sp.]